MKQRRVPTEKCSYSYEELEDNLRIRLSENSLSYREIASIVGWSHTQLWSFHKQNCKLQFDVLERLATLYKEPYVLTNVTGRGQNPSTSVEALVGNVRAALDEATSHGISYRKIASVTRISHEWVRCFHVKKSTMEVRKVMAIANYLGVPYELSNLSKI